MMATLAEEKREKALSAAKARLQKVRTPWCILVQCAAEGRCEQRVVCLAHVHVRGLIGLGACPRGVGAACCWWAAAAASLLCVSNQASRLHAHEPLKLPQIEVQAWMDLATPIRGVLGV